MGAKYYWTVEVEDASGGGYSPVEFQALSFSYGRNEVTEDFPAGQVNISGIKPDSLPAAFGKVNSKVRMRLYSNNGTLRVEKACFARSLTRTYGTRPNLDTWNFNGVGSLVRLAEQQLTADYTLTAGSDTGTAISSLFVTYGMGIAYQYGLSNVSGTTFTAGTYLNDIVQTITRTEQGRLREVGLGVDFLARGWIIQQATKIVFSDGTVAAPGIPVAQYMSVDFVNNGQYFANTVIVSPDGLADQVFGSARPVLNFNTVDQTSTQANSLAQYIKSVLDFNVVRPFSITFNVDAQPFTNFLNSLETGFLVRVDLRGVSYQCVVEGYSVNANASTTEATLILSSADAYRFLILNDSVFGTLDNNRLGF